MKNVCLLIEIYLSIAVFFVANKGIAAKTAPPLSISTSFDASRRDKFPRGAKVFGNFRAESIFHRRGDIE